MRVLAVVAHPDDEVIGVGGTLARHAARGDEVEVLILGDGKSSRRGEYRPLERETLEASHGETEAACRALGVSRVRRLELPDNRFDSLPLLDVVKQVDAVVSELGPEVVYTHHAGDLNVDHEVTHRAVMTCTRPLPGCGVRWVHAFETLSSTEWNYLPGAAFQADYFVDIGDTLEAKLKAMAAYASELREPPHPRSLEVIEQNARVWGARSGFRAAEAFRVVRGLWGGW